MSTVRLPGRTRRERDEWRTWRLSAGDAARPLELLGDVVAFAGKAKRLLEGYRRAMASPRTTAQVTKARSAAQRAIDAGARLFALDVPSPSNEQKEAAAEQLRQVARALEDVFRWAPGVRRTDGIADLLAMSHEDRRDRLDRLLRFSAVLALPGADGAIDLEYLLHRTRAEGLADSVVASAMVTHELLDGALLASARAILAEQRPGFADMKRRDLVAKVRKRLENTAKRGSIPQKAK